MHILTIVGIVVLVLLCALAYGLYRFHRFTQRPDWEKVMDAKMLAWTNRQFDRMNRFDARMNRFDRWFKPLLHGFGLFLMVAFGILFVVSAFHHSELLLFKSAFGFIMAMLLRYS